MPSEPILVRVSVGDIAELRDFVLATDALICAIRERGLTDALLPEVQRVHEAAGRLLLPPQSEATE